MAKRSAAEVATGAAVLAVTAGFLVYALSNTGQSSASGLTLSAQFDNVGALPSGADVRLSGVPIGRVLGTTIDPKTFQAVVRFTIRSDIHLPIDSSAVISTGGLLGSPFLTVSPGGSDKDVKDGGVLTITQSATNLEDLLGKFIFNVGALADATQKSLLQKGQDTPDAPEPAAKPCSRTARPFPAARRSGRWRRTMPKRTRCSRTRSRTPSSWASTRRPCGGF